MITNEVKKYLENSVLCWLATVNTKFEPNVSPKEMFVFQNDKSILIANIASPISERNILENPLVCVSFVDVLVQKGFKMKGIATVISKKDPEFTSKLQMLTNKFSDKYPIHSIIEIKVTRILPIIAPSYLLFPQSTTEESQIQNAIERYKLKRTQD